MQAIRRGLFLLGWFLAGFARAELPPDTEAGFRAIVALVRDQEKLIPKGVRYEHTEKLPDGATERREAFTLEDGTLLKAAIERTDAAGADLTEYNVGSDGGDYFRFHRKSARQEDGSLRVEEERKYWYHFEVVRWTRRSANFPAGTEPEMKDVPMVVRSLINLSADDRRSDLLVKAAEEIFAGLQAFPPVQDPAAGAEPEWQRVKLIKASLSPDGRYQLAWGPNEKEIDWAKYKQEGGSDFMSITETNLSNYVADLQTHRIAGRTLGSHFGTRERYNHRACHVAWSPDSRFFAQLTTEKWDYSGFCAGEVKNGKVTGCIDFAKPALAAAGKFLASTRNGAWKKHHGQLSLQFGNVEVASNGTIAFTLWEEVPKSDLPNDSFELRGRMRLTSSPKGLQLAPVGFSYPKTER